MRKFPMFGLAAGMMMLASSFTAQAQEPTYTLNPASGSTVTELTQVTIDFADNSVAFYENNKFPVAVITNTSTGMEYSCQDPDRLTKTETGGVAYGFTFVDEAGDAVQINTPGTYEMTVRAAYYMVGEEQVDFAPIKATYTVSYPADYVLDPAPGVVENLQDMTLTFPNDKVMFYENNRMPSVVVENLDNGVAYTADPMQNTFAAVDGVQYSFKFVDEDGDPVVVFAPGNYELSIKAMYMEGVEENIDLPMIVERYSVKYPIAYELVPAPGVATDLMRVTVNFPETKAVEFYENGRMPVAVLENLNNGKVYNCQDPDRLTQYPTEGIAYQFVFIGQDEEEAMPITEAGNYQLTIRSMYDGGDVDYPVINANYLIMPEVNYNLSPDNGAFVADLSRIQIEFPDDNTVAFYENNRMPAASLQNVNTGKVYTCQEPDRLAHAATEGVAYELVFADEDGDVLPITEPGHYTLAIRSMYHEVDGEQVSIQPIYAEYNVAFPVTYYLNPDNGATVENLKEVVLQFPENKNVAFFENNRMPVAVLENVTTGKVYNCADAVRNTRATEGAEYTLTFIGEDDEEAMDITEPGHYTMTVRSMYLEGAEGEEDITLPVINAEYNIAYPVVYYLNPENGATVENLMNVVLQFPENKNVAFFENNRMPVAVLENVTTGKVYNCADAVRNTRVAEGSEYTLTFIGEDDEEAMDITEPGHYTMTVRAMYLEAMEEDQENIDLPVINAEYNIAYPVVYYLNPDNGATVENLMNVVLQFPENTDVAFFENNRMPVAVLENTTNGKIYTCQEADKNARAMEGTEYTLTFIAEGEEEAMPITEPGHYTMTVRALGYVNADGSMGESLPVINAEYNVAYPVQYVLTPDNGATVSNLQGIVLTFPQNKNVTFYENNRMPVAVLENLNNGKVYNCETANRNTRAEEGSEYVLMFIGSDDDEAMDINEPGNYKLTVRAMYLEGEAEDDNIDLPVINAEYTVGYPVAYYLNPENGSTVSNLQNITVQFPDNKNVAFYENNRMPVAVLENVTTGKVYNCEGAVRNTRAEQGCEYSFVFIGEDDDEAMAITEPGNYKLAIRAMYLEAMEEDQDNIDLPVIFADYTIAYPVAYYLNPENGSSVKEIKSVDIQFPENKNVTFYENNRMPVAVIENNVTGKVYNCETAVRNTRVEEGCAYTFVFIGEDDEEAMPITEPGSYTMTIRAMALADEEGQIVEDLPVINANYTIEYPVAYYLNPDNGATVEDLMTVTIQFPENKNVAFYENNRMPVAVLENVTTGSIYNCETAVRNTRAEEGCEYSFVFIGSDEEEAMPITEVGHYVMTVRAMYLEGEDIDLPVINAEYNIAYPVDYILTPADGSNVESLTTVSIEFPNNNNVQFYENNKTPVAVLVNNTTGVEYFAMEANRDTRAMTEGVVYNFVFMAEDAEEVEEITALGNYTLTISQLALVEGDEFTALPNITANYTIPYPVQYVLTPDDGATVEDLMNISIEFPANKVAFYENNRMPVAVLENVTTGSVYVCEEPVRDTFAMTDGTLWNMTFIAEGEEEAAPITEMGSYVLTIKSLGMVVDDELEALPVITANYTIGYPIVYNLDPIADATVECIEVVTLEFPNNKNIGFAENNRMPIAVLENTTTGSVYTADFAERNTHAMTEGIEYQFRFAPEGEEEVVTIEENGAYTLTIKSFGYTDEEGEIVDFLPVITATYYIVNASSVEGVEVLGDDVFNVYTLGGVQVVKNGNANDVQGLDAGLYIINGKKVLIRK